MEDVVPLTVSYALKEGIVSCAVVAVGAGKDASTTLSPGAGLDRVTPAPSKQTQAVRRTPAVRSGKCKVGPAAHVKGCRSLVNGMLLSFPRRCGCRDNRDRTSKGDIVVGQFLYANRLVLLSVEARVYEVIAPRSIEPHHGAVDTPLIAHCTDVCVCVVPGACTTCTSRKHPWSA